MHYKFVVTEVDFFFLMPPKQANADPGKVQEGKIVKPRYEIELDRVTLAIGAAWFLYGLILLIYTRTNDNVDPYDPACTVVDGKLHSWLSHMSYMMLVYGFFGLVVGGCVPKTFQACHLKDEAICCSDVCQGMCGKVTRAFLFVSLVILNFYGLFYLVTAYNSDVQYEYPALKTTFCKTAFFEFSLVTNIIVITIIFTMLLLACRACFLAMKYDSELGENKFGPKGENIEKELGLLPEQQKNRKKKLRAQRARKKALKKRGGMFGGRRRKPPMRGRRKRPPPPASSGE